MQTEYNAADETTAIAPPISEPLGDGGIKALNSERERGRALEKQNKQLEAMLAENNKALQQSQMTLEQKYQADLEAPRQSYQSQVDAALAERDQRFQTESEARQVAEQRSQILENQNATTAIFGEFSNTFSQVLVNPKKVDGYMAEIADDLVTDSNGQPALVVRRDDYGRPVELAPISAAIGYFQQKYPEDFKPPTEQKTGGGYRNLASGNLASGNRQGQSQPLTINPRNIDPETFLANRDRIRAGDFEVESK